MPKSNTNLLRIAQAVFLIAALWFAAHALSGQWTAVRDAASQAKPHWWLLTASTTLVFATYALLIETWRVMVEGWRSPGKSNVITLSFSDATRIWLISSLGRYLPGKFWQFGTIAVMAQQRGISGVAAAGSSLLVTVINTTAGFLVLALTGARVLELPPAALTVLVLIGVGLVVLPVFLPRLANLATKLTGRDFMPGAISPRAVWLAAGASVVAWVMYGLAFHVFGIGLLGHATGAPALSIAIFTGSYLAGFLTLIAPGGLMVREGVMLAALTGAGVGAGPAALLVVASRLWLTVIELVPPLLLLGTTRVTREA